MNISDDTLKKVLLAGDYVSEADITEARKGAPKEESLELSLKRIGVVSDDIIGQAFADSLGVPYFDLGAQDIPNELTQKLPEDIAKTYRVILVKLDDAEVHVVTDDPLNKDLLVALRKVFLKQKIKISFSIPGDIDVMLVKYRKKLETRFQDILKRSGRVAPELLAEIFEDAVVEKASDIHFEPFEKEVIIRFRVDGILYHAGSFVREHYESLLNKIKVLAQLRIDEHFTVQDGALRYVPHGREGAPARPIDMRVSIVPTLYGEKVAIRILSRYVETFDLKDLGLSSLHQEQIARAAQKPFGMILTTGPTGSGKTTTLYALLKHINTPDINITTIEDPVEYKINGVNQIQVNQATNLTFAKGLRSIVRQDPDVILVGEIRDEETADIAVTAALTGHRLFSTFHANNAATSIPRLRDMNIEPFLLASTLELIIAQRLVRKICDHCRVSEEVTYADIMTKVPEAKSFFPKGETHRLYKGKGCEVCSGTGYKGRIGLFEFIEVGDAMEALILTDPSAEEVWQLAEKEGALPMFADGMQKVKEGITTLEEVLRVVDASEYVAKNKITKTKKRAKKAKLDDTTGKEA